MRRSSDTLEAVTAWIRDAANVELFTVSGTTVTGAMLVTVAVVVLVGFAASRAVRVAARHCLRRRGLQGPLDPGSFVSLQEDKSAGWGDVDPSRLSLTASSRRPRDKATARPKTPDPIVASTVGTSSPRGHHAPDPPTTPGPPDPEVEASAPDRGARRGSFARLADPCVGPARTVDRGAWPCPPPRSRPAPNASSPHSRRISRRGARSPRARLAGRSPGRRVGGRRCWTRSGASSAPSPGGGGSPRSSSTSNGRSSRSTARRTSSSRRASSSGTAT